MRDIPADNTMNMYGEHNQTAPPAFPEPLDDTATIRAAGFNRAPEPDKQRSGRSLIDKRLLEMIAQAAAGEAAAAKYYKKLSEMLISEDDKKTVRTIMLDEVKHRRLFEELFYHISGERLNTEGVQNPEQGKDPSGSFPAIFEERIHDETHDVAFYRQIYFALNSLEYRDIMYEIITDEQIHATLLNCLFAKYLR